MILNEVSGVIGNPVPLLKAINLHKYGENYQAVREAYDFTIPYTADFKQQYIEPGRDHNRNPPERPLNPWLLTNQLESAHSFSPIPTNRDHSELLEVKVVS